MYTPIAWWIVSATPIYEAGLRHPLLWVSWRPCKSIVSSVFRGTPKPGYDTCQQKKTRSRHSLALPNVGQIQEISLRDRVSCSVTWERGYTGERERRCKRIHLQYFPYSIGNLPRWWTTGRTRLVLPLYAFWSILVYKNFDHSST